MEYELLFFTSLANEGNIPDIKKEIKDTISKFSGKISADFSDIGQRKFAYPIKRQTHGFYCFCRFSMEEKDKLPEIDRRLKLNENILRHLIVRAEEIGKNISAGQVATDRKPSIKKAEPAKKEEKPVETKAKVGMEDLDEKLSEILEESPE